ncbi:hypothetical protein DM02DRAFT_664771 [Periconia macrospinosa]|uniref:Uncharacterized protein n=1 Tax=Periconia macrospinosa TaxID=97972 RepID=A0A2V1D0C7_9PLEO|nr:hypothetical protein DM02DRAFT_664771 [Periconia macrospinosa]
MELTRKNFLLQAYKSASEVARGRMATYFWVLSKYSIQDNNTQMTPEEVENAIGSSTTMSEQCMALLERLFRLAGVWDGEDKGLSPKFTVDENMFHLMQIFKKQIWSIASKQESPEPRPVKPLSGQFPLVLSYLGCNLDGIKHLPSLMSAPLVSGLALLPCQAVSELFKEIDVCLRYLDYARPPHLNEFTRDEVAAIIPRYRYLGCLQDYALSSDATKWYYDYLVALEYDSLAPTRRMEGHFCISFLVGLSMLRALQEEESKPPKEQGEVCWVHQYHAYIYERVRWTVPLARLCGAVVSPHICCEKAFWDVIRNVIEVRLAANLVNLDHGERVLANLVIRWSFIKPDDVLAELGSLHV